MFRNLVYTIVSWCPSRLVPALPVKCTMADKSTKTDEALLNGDLDVLCPTTTNAATMTTVVPTDAPSRTGTVVTTSINSKNHTPVQRQDSRSEPTKNSASPPPNQVRSIDYCFICNVIISVFSYPGEKFLFSSLIVMNKTV